MRDWGVVDLGARIDANGAFLDTAAMMKHLDLVITSDTAIAHLAGALGVPVWMATSTAPDWRWLQDRDDSPWYPTMRLFRQRKRGDWADVFARMAQALESHPRLESAERYGQRGLDLLKEGRPADAVALFDRAIELEPMNAVLHNNRAVAHDRAGKKDNAQAGFAEAARLKPDYGDALHNLGNMLRRLGRLAEAEAAYRKAMPHLRDSADLLNHLGIALLGQGKHAEAEACLRRALKLRPDLAEAHNNLGVVCEQTGRLEEASAAYQESLRLKPDAIERPQEPRAALADARRLCPRLAGVRMAAQIGRAGSSPSRAGTVGRWRGRRYSCTRSRGWATRSSSSAMRGWSRNAAGSCWWSARRCW